MGARSLRRAASALCAWGLGVALLGGVGGCTEQLALAPRLDGGLFDGALPTADAAADGGPLPGSCARLSCVPGLNEGSVTLSSGSLGGCRAFDQLTIAGTVAVEPGQPLAVCAQRILVTGLMTALGAGAPADQGPGAGLICGSGGSHGGLGADPGRCGRGAQYGDALLPRTLGSGGGSLVGSMGGGAGGGAIELVADELQLLAGFIVSDGAPAMLPALSGGGAGGSVLLAARAVTGTGMVSARGGAGLGGGGGGRIAIRGLDPAAMISTDVDPGPSASSGGEVAEPGSLQLEP